MMMTSCCSGTYSHRPSAVFEDFQRGKPAGSAHNSAARVCCRAAHIKVLDGRAELRVSRDWAQKEKLFERKFALEDVALAQPKLTFEVQRREHLFIDNDVAYVGRVLCNCIDHIVAEGLALVV